MNDIKDTASNTDNGNRNLILFGTVTILGLLSIALYFIARVDIYSLGGDQFRWVNLIEKMYRGELLISDLWAAHGSHRAPAYKSLFLLNARYFGLNMQYEQVLGAFAWSAAALMIIYAVRNHLNDVRILIGALVSVTIPFLVMNGNVMTTVLTYSVISLRMIDLTCFLVIFHLTSRALVCQPSASRSAVIAVLIVLCSQFIGRGWGQGMLATVLFILISYAVVCRNKCDSRRIYTTLLPIALVTTISLLIYQMGIEHDESKGVAGLSRLLDIPSLLSFLLALLGRTLTFKHVGAEGGQNILLIQSVGGFVVATYVLATYYYFKDRQYEQGWFPIALIAFAFAAAMLVYLGRGAMIGEGWRGALFPRHLPEVSLGLVGALVIIASYARKSNVLKNALVSVCIVLIVSQSLAVARSIHQIKFIKKYNAERAMAFFGPIENFSSRKTIDMARCHSQRNCVLSREIISRYGLMETARQKSKLSEERRR